MQLGVCLTSLIGLMRVPRCHPSRGQVADGKLAEDLGGAGESQELTRLKFKVVEAQASLIYSLVNRSFHDSLPSLKM